MTRGRKFDPMKVADTYDAQLLSRAIGVSGMSVHAFARHVVREPRTVFRYLSGEIRLPNSVREMCERLTAELPPLEIAVCPIHGTTHDAPGERCIRDEPSDDPDYVGAAQ